VRKATTVIVLREGTSGVQVLLLRRHRRNVFLPDAWVFPGGRVDARDADVERGRVTGITTLARALSCDLKDAFVYGVAGVRETMEESGVWLGEGTPAMDARAELLSGMDFGDWMAAHDLRIDLGRFSGWAWWVTPRGEPRRYDTRFLVARWDGPAEQAVHDARETVASGWFCPGECVDQSIEDFPLAPPTWWTLKELVGFQDIDAIVRASSGRPCVPVQPILDVTATGLEVWLPGHPEHGDGAVKGLPSCITMRDGVWSAT
jgi:8-oxo-dGTP pyrophosphatase MutT (NUDIX family)